MGKSSMNKPAMQLVAEHRAKQNIRKNSSALPSSKGKQISELHAQKMVFPPDSDSPEPGAVGRKSLSAKESVENKDLSKQTSGQSKKAAFGQQR
jgi:hypothetical protein